MLPQFLSLLHLDYRQLITLWLFDLAMSRSRTKQQSEWKTIKYFIRQRSKNERAREKYANAKNYAYAHNDAEKEEQGRKTHTVDRLKSQCQETATRQKIGNDVLVWEDERKLIAARESNALCNNETYGRIQILSSIYLLRLHKTDVRMDVWVQQFLFDRFQMHLHPLCSIFDLLQHTHI